jgi:hypothetical protein
MALLSQRRYCLLSNSIGLLVKTTPHLHSEMKEEESFSAVIAGNCESNIPTHGRSRQAAILLIVLISGRYSTSIGV